MELSKRCLVIQDVEKQCYPEQYFLNGILTYFIQGQKTLYTYQNQISIDSASSPIVLEIRSKNKV